MFKKIILPLALVIALSVSSIGAVTSSAADDSIHPDTPMVPEYLETFRETFKQDIVAELTKEGGMEPDESFESIPDKDQNFLVTYEYLNLYLEQLKEEIKQELLHSGSINLKTEYEDVSVTAGKTILLHSDTEVIFRGGNAVAITSSAKELEGITDMSGSKELFSGMSLEYGHIYYASATDSKKAIFITGETAYFTIRGDYEIS